KRVLTERGSPASARPVLMGITKASLATDSWLAAASFQEPTRVHTDSATNQRADTMATLSDNGTIGRRRPAGTGTNRYPNATVEATEEARAAAYSIPAYGDGFYGPEDGFGDATGASVRLDDLGY